jgi:uncharacterized Zn-binding protein involved in type VI secretion
VKGWVFGASCKVLKDGVYTDLSENVKWSGTATFNPEVGHVSKPIFNGTGPNTIKLSCDVDGKTVTKTYTVSAVSTAKYARVGDKAQVPACAHGCPACPHPAIGPAISGSPNVFIDDKPALRVGDPGVHAACCDGNCWEASYGDGSVIINGRRAVKIGDATTHCGGVGRIVEGSSGD